MESTSRVKEFGLKYKTNCTGRLEKYLSHLYIISDFCTTKSKNQSGTDVQPKTTYIKFRSFKIKLFGILSTFYGTMEMTTYIET